MVDTINRGDAAGEDSISREEEAGALVARVVAAEGEEEAEVEGEGAEEFADPKSKTKEKRKFRGNEERKRAIVCTQ